MSQYVSKFRNLVFEKGKVLNKYVILIMVSKNKCSIPKISENLVKIPRRTISDSLSDKHQVDNLSLSVNKGFALIHKSNHIPVRELWILQHLLLPQLRWPPLIYEAPMTTVVKLVEKISNFIRK